MQSSNRREFIRLSAAATGAMASQALPGAIQKALAIPAHHETGTIRDVKHIVILMQENRSFDHYFGTLKGVRGFGDPRPALMPDGKPVWYQPDGKGGVVLPFHPDAPDLGMQFMAGTPHDWNSSHQAWNEGRYNQWIAAKGQHTMASFKRSDIPFHFALADAFTICDAYHCALMGPTDPNRYHMWTGWVGNDGQGGGPVIDNAEAGYGWSTYPERLEKAGISWKIYQDVGNGLNAAGYWGWTDDPYIGNYGDNSLLYFHQYQNAKPGEPLYEKAVTGTNVLGDKTQTFFDILKKDVANGQLPQVSWIVAPEAYSEHPNWPANYGAWYISQVLEILTSNEQLWSQTALFITYDENDGFFDHVVPPSPPMSRDHGLSTVDVGSELFAGNSHYQAGPYGLGQRVPMIEVSPWSRGGWVCSQVFDHTSLIRFIEQRFAHEHPELIESNITAWRRAVCGDLTSAFNFANPNAKVPPLPSTASYVPADALRHASYLPVPPSQQSLPKQEPGLRWSRPLPYVLQAQSSVDTGRGVRRLDFDNAGQAGATFLVTSVGSANAPRTYTVEAGKSLSDEWLLGGAQAEGLDLIVTGPAGFYRRYQGVQPGLAIRVEQEREHNALELRLRNEGASALHVRVSPNAYAPGAGRESRKITLRAGESIELHWNLGDTLGWYDLAVSVEGRNDFLYRLAGRVETGRASVSDPANGRV
jgi:phospholipase C